MAKKVLAFIGKDGCLEYRYQWDDIIALSKEAASLGCEVEIISEEKAKKLFEKYRSTNARASNESCNKGGRKLKKLIDRAKD